IVIASLAFAVIAGYGIDSFFKGIIARFRKPIPTLLISFLFFLMIAEVWIVPLPTKPVKIPEFYQNLGNKSENFALLEIPGNRDTWSTAMFYQTFHSKKIVGGHTGFNVPEYKFIENSPVISALAKMDIDKFKKDKQNFSEEIITTLQNMKIRYVIVNLKNWYYLKTGSFSGQKLKTGQPLYPLFLRGFPFKWDEPDKDILKLFLSSKERKDLENIFGTPIYLDKKIVAYNIL
ncbi:MAG: hypothetical protein HXY47_05215, partial [Nitrospirae bacterium]|nr:hypothetical protein [Nitrospirota bacterium]